MRYLLAITDATFKEGGMWHSVHVPFLVDRSENFDTEPYLDDVGKRLEDICRPIGFHAVRIVGGREWDCINGWRKP